MANDNQPDHKPIDKKVFDGFFAELDRLKKTKDDAGMAMAQCHKEHQNTYKMHKDAVKLVYKLRNMDATERAEFLSKFDEYRDTMGLDDQLDLFDGDDEKEAA